MAMMAWDSCVFGGRIGLKHVYEPLHLLIEAFYEVGEPTIKLNSTSFHQDTRPDI